MRYVHVHVQGLIVGEDVKHRGATSIGNTAAHHSWLAKMGAYMQYIQVTDTGL